MPAEPIRQITLRPSDVWDEHPYDLCNWVEIFVSVALTQKGYFRSELPRDMVDFGDLMTYYGAVRDGGHFPCVDYAETGDVLENAARLLGKIGLADFRANILLFAEYCRSQALEIEHLLEDCEGHGGYKLFESFDDRFSAIERTTGPLDRALCDWLVLQPWLILDADAPPTTYEYVSSCIPPHPVRNQRYDAERRERVAENSGAVMAFLARLFR